MTAQVFLYLFLSFFLVEFVVNWLLDSLNQKSLIVNPQVPDFFQDWTNRIFHQYYSGMDITLSTRLAEWSGQIHSLTENMRSLIFGRGLGSEYFWDYNFFFALKSVYSWSYLINKSAWYGGHSTWIYSLYSGGLLFGWIIIAISFLSLFRIMIVVNNKDINNDRLKKSNAPLFLFLT